MKMTIKAAKGNFFDRKKVQDLIGKDAAKALTRMGGLVRKIAQRSMRRKKGPSKPGTAPNAHKGYLRDFMFFTFDPATKKMVVGPAKLGKSTAPEIVGRGGVVEEWGVYDRRGRFTPLRVMDRKGREAARRGGKVIKRKSKVEARPFMELAMKAAKPQLEKIMQEYFRKGKGKQ